MYGQFSWIFVIKAFYIVYEKKKSFPCSGLEENNKYLNVGRCSFIEFHMEPIYLILSTEMLMAHNDLKNKYKKPSKLQRTE